MNDKTRLIFFGALAFIVILTTCVLAYVWGKTSAKPVTVDDSLQGYYAPVAVNGRSTTNQTPQLTTLLPTFDTPGVCDPDSICVSNGDTDDPYCYCKKKLGAPCNLVFECAPSTDPTKSVYCNNVCSEIQGNLFASCSFDPDLNCGTGLACSNTLPSNLNSVVGECLLVDNQVCTFDEQCYGGKCEIIGNATSGTCISRVPAGEHCDIDYCEKGFGCDFSTGITARQYCQPLITADPKTNSATIPAEFGKSGALCQVTNDFFNFYSCDPGLTCNIDHTTGGPVNYPIALYPSLDGFGTCQPRLFTINDTCQAVGACHPPSVCGGLDSNGNTICSAPNYLTSLTTSVSDINYCGRTYASNLINGSSGFCSDGYECVENPSITVYPDITYNRFCLPKNNHFCTNDPGAQGRYCVNSSGATVSGSCTGKKIGVFLTGFATTYLGKWVSVDLPDQSIPANQVNINSEISVFEYMPLPSASNPAYPMVRIIFYPYSPPSSTQFFFYTEFSTYEFTANENYSPTWSNITVQVAPGAVTLINLLDIKFTSAGNFGLFVKEERGFYNPFNRNTDQTGGTNIAQYNRLYVANFATDFNLPGLTLTYTPSNYGPLFAENTDAVSYTPATINQMCINAYDFYSWDIDDSYNNSVVIGLVNPTTPTDFNFYYNTIFVPSLNNLSVLSNISPTLTVNLSDRFPSYVKFYTDNAVGPNIGNYVYTYNDGVYKLFVNGSLSYVSGNNFIQFGSTNSPATLATVFSKNYTLSGFNIYYMPAVSSGDINIISVERTYDIPTGEYTFNSTENKITSYSPSEVTTFSTLINSLQFISAGGFTNYMYSLMETCEI